MGPVAPLASDMLSFGEMLGDVYMYTPTNIHIHMYVYIYI